MGSLAMAFAGALSMPAAAQGVRMLPGSRVETHGKGAWQVVAADLDLDGVLDLVARDGSPQQGFRVLLGRGDGSFENGVPYSGPETNTFGFADFTGDGIPDLVTGDYNPDPPLGVWVYPGLGDGTLGTPITSPLPTGNPNLLFLAPGDFDGDGRLDLALKTIGFFPALRFGHGNGDGSFGPFVLIASSGLAGLAAADFDQDGRLDLIDGNQLAVRLGNGDGTFQAPILNSPPSSALRVRVADLDGDGLLDTVSGAAGDVRVHLGTGDGHLVEIGHTVASSYESDFELADLDGDSRLDLVAARQQTVGPGGVPPGLTVRLGLPDHTFGPSTFYRTGGEPFWMTAGDFDGDGEIDAAFGQLSQVSDAASEDVGLAFGRGDGSFAAPDTVALHDPPLATELADMNGDGHLDLVCTVEATLPAVRIALGHGDGSFDAPVGVDLGDNAGELAVADLDGDGALDLVVAGDPPFGATVAALGSGDGVSFGAPVQVATGDVVDVGVAQLDDDDAPDIAVARFADGVVTIYHGDGQGGFGPGQYLSAGGFPNAMVLADLDGDARTDIALADSNNVVALLRNLGGGAFADPQTLPDPGGPLRIVAADFDRDGVLDLATAHKQPMSVKVFLGTGGGSFAPPIATGLGHTARALAAGDVNRDGLPDLVGIHGVEPALFAGDEDELLGSVSLLIGRGDGTFLRGACSSPARTRSTARSATSTRTACSTPRRSASRARRPGCCAT
jgi:hypothetical protein